MLFSSPDYPIFLIGVFFLYALSRRSGWARAALMVMFADTVVAIISKDVDGLWDPLGGIYLRLVADHGFDASTWAAFVLERWIIGSALLALAVWVGRRFGGWIASEAGQRVVGWIIVGVLAVVGLQVLYGWQTDSLPAITEAWTQCGHLLVLAILGVAIGAAQSEANRLLGRVLVLFVVSALFYQAWASTLTTADGEAPNPAYRYLLALLLGTIVLDYYLGIWIEGTQEEWKRRLLVVVSVCSNLGILVFFKYTDFFAQDVLHMHVKPLHLILPAGISFHTFQSMSYTIDVYRRELKATRSVVKFATFVLFFPQLVAGPIVRAQDLLPQLDELPALELERSTRALFRIVVGLFKKIALADTLAMSMVDRVFADPTHFSSVEVLAGVYAYAMQIYLDFSAYSDIAIASAELLGFGLPENFRTPYRSANLQEFWRRWHISLSTWLRDYLYISLGGSRGAAWRTYLNLSLTMVLGGLWHGASWTFIVWGALHGFGLAITRVFQRAANPLRLVAITAGVAAAGLAVHVVALRGEDIWLQLVWAWLYATPLWAVLTASLGDEVKETVVVPRWPAPENTSVLVLRLLTCAAGVTFFAALEWGESWTWVVLATVTFVLGWAADLAERTKRVDWARALGRGVAIVLVFHYVCLAWIFFRAQSFDHALAVLEQLGKAETDHANVGPIVRIGLLCAFLCHFYADGTFRWLREKFAGLHPVLQGLVLAVCAMVLRQLSHPKIVPFIYFQF